MTERPSPTGFHDRRGEQLRKLTEISRALTYAVSADQVLRLATERAADLLESRSALLMLPDEDGLLRVRASHGVEPAVLARFQDPARATLLARLQGLLGAPTPESYLAVPLVAHGAVTGMLAVARAEGLPFDDEDEWLLSAAADQVAVALEYARLEEELRRDREARTRGRGEAEGANDRALATLSHDLRSPLNAIDSYAELIEMAILGPVSERQLEALGRIRMSGRHLLAVLENVLDMTRLTAGAVRVHAAPVPVAAVMEEAVLMVRPGATARNQSVTLGELPKITLSADPDRLRQVLVNLIGNAVKYTPPSGTIALSASELARDGRRWGLVVVADTGPGIPAERLQAIFEPYFRLPGAETDAPEGLGLGLAISRELVRQMGGDIEVESEPGRGSRFTVRLPLVEGETSGG